MSKLITCLCLTCLILTLLWVGLLIADMNCSLTSSEN